MHSMNASRHASLLFPNSGKTNPAEQTYSPLAQFSSLTLQEHEEAARNLQVQQEAIVQASAQIAAQEAEDNRRHQSTMNALAREEAELLHQLANNKKFRENLEFKSAEEATKRKESIEANKAEALTLQEEEDSLCDLEGELRTMLAEMEAKVGEVSERTRFFKDETNRGMSVLHHDQHEAHVLATTTQNLNPRPGGVDSKILSPSRHRNATSPMRNGGLNDSRVLLPHQQPGLTSSLGVGGAANSVPTSPERKDVTPPRRSDVVVGTIRRNSPERSAANPIGAAPSSVFPSSMHHRSPPKRAPLDAPSVSFAPHNNSIVTSTEQRHPSTHSVIVSPTKAGFSNRQLQMSQASSTMQDIRANAEAQGMPSSPPSIHSGGQLVAAQSSGPPVGAADSTRLHAIVSSVSSPSTTSSHPGALVDDALKYIRAHPNDVNHLDELGNTALHIACAVPDASLEVIHALLLAGCNAAVKNSDGLTAFHVACLNTTDTSHKLKKFMLFKAAQNPNLRTGKGETAAHLCSDHDKHLETLKFLSTVGVDLSASALLSGSDGTPRRMTALDKARAAGNRAAGNRAFLESLP